MRKIDKGNPIASFITYCATNKGSNWDDFHQNAKACYQDCRLQILLEEQNCLCGYTEICITEIANAHLDHFRKKSIFPELTFEWSNLVAATLDSDFGANYKDSTYRIKKEEYPNIFNPVVDNVHSYFYYNQRGEIEPRPVLTDDLKTKVNTTIAVFNLNHKSLKTRRETIINQIKDCKDLTTEEILEAFNSSGFVSVVEQERSL